jgi:phosphoribosylanthranilate isomerase
MIKIKICGIKTEVHALAAAKAGADFIGLVFAPSPRQVSPVKAEKIVTALKDSGAASPEIVGVFVNTPVYVVNRITKYCRLDWVQLSGEENMEYCQEITSPIIKVLRIRRDYQPEQVCKDLAAWSKVLSNQKHKFLLDSYDQVKYGGTGKQLERDTVKEVASRFPVIIAGGLTPDNVSSIVVNTRPWGVDTSSGVESKGGKDVNKIKAFINAVRDADAV